MNRVRWLAAAGVVLVLLGAGGAVTLAVRDGAPAACGLVGEGGEPIVAAPVLGGPRVQRRFEPTALASVPVRTEPSPVWTMTLPALGLDGADLVTAGPALLALTEGDVVAIDAATGAVSWRVHCDESLFPSIEAVAIGPTVVVSIVGPERDIVCALDLGDGTGKWCRTGSLLEDSATGLTVAVARYDDGEVHVASVDVGTGRDLWGRRVRGERVMASDSLVAIVDGGLVTAIDRHRGDVVDEAELPVGDVTVAGGTVAVLSGSTLTSWVPDVAHPEIDLPGAHDVVPASEGFVVDTDSAEEPISRLVFGGKLVWSGDAFPILSVAAPPDLTLLARESGTLIAVDVLTGDERWRVDDVAVPQEAIAVADGVVYAVLVDYRAEMTTLAAFDLLDGSRLWERPLDDTDSLAELVAVDAGVVVSDGSTLTAYRIADG